MRCVSRRAVCRLRVNLDTIQQFQASDRLLIGAGRLPHLRHDLVEREGAGWLARREGLERGQILRHEHLRWDQQEDPIDAPVVHLPR